MGRYFVIVFPKAAAAITAAVLVKKSCATILNNTAEIFVSKKDQQKCILRQNQDR